MPGSFHRRNLPHLYFEDGTYFITYRLANTIARSALKSIKRYPQTSWDFVKFTRLLQKYESLLNSDEYGINYLQQKEIADICKLTLHYPDGKDYKLICYTIMPNHVHLVFTLLEGNKGISKIMQSIKRVSASRSNIFLNRSGKFWQEESFDRWIRNDVELFFVIRYVLLNPVKAGLVKNWYDWEYTYCLPAYIVL